MVATLSVRQIMVLMVVVALAAVVAVTLVVTALGGHPGAIDGDLFAKGTIPWAI